ncbi:MAG: aminoglycoside 6-adenylyltransferase [bacterium]
MKNKQIELQHQTIEQVTSILYKYDSVAAAALIGSHADNTNTAFSDIDLIVVFEDDERKNLKTIFKEIVSLKHTLSTLYQIYDKESLILYEDGVRLDLTLEKRSNFEKRRLKSARVLFDRKGIMRHIIKDSREKDEILDHPEWNDKEGSFIDWFFWMFRQAYCYTCQSELIPEKSFEKKDLAINSVKLIRDKLLDTLYYVNSKKDYLVNIDKKLLSKFSQTYPGNSIGEIKSSIRILVKLYEKIIGKYCLKENKKFPEEKVKIIKNLFVEFDSYC